ncbi:SDR family NAD(P)-dependent oxidoreductase [Flavilitoribacter nigricans]|uniref:SDR family NAD(P)-dependent oxidoreductase n=1 Tax=Flavilitoribacter nigricans TaxID=70997 RepID=UPI00147432F4|nr:SDR family oxidoreductase [Flavilitoribacter nigricans]
MDLSHLKVLVTGGGGVGVGAGVCEALDQFGATLIINEKESEKAEQAVKKYRNALPVQADITDEAQVKRMFGTIAEKLGPINGLVNNAGVGLTKAVQDIEEWEFDRLYSVNVKGMWLVSKYFVRQLLAHRIPGNIVNVSSVHGFASQPNYSTYASSKAAVEGFTRAIAFELGRYGIRCNAIGPGYVHAEQNFDLIRKWADDPEAWAREFKDDQQALHHFIEPVDCGNTAAFLLSELSRSITGQTIYVDGGKTIMLFNRNYVEPKV